MSEILDILDVEHWLFFYTKIRLFFGIIHHCIPDMSACILYRIDITTKGFVSPVDA